MYGAYLVLGPPAFPSWEKRVSRRQCSRPCERRRTIQVDYTSKNEQFVLFVLETDCERRQNQRAEACAQANPNRLSKPRYKSNSPALSPALSPAV
ncbi:hypothetical protein Moror_4332 [Moniliophthora roreri MCA 2997]|uniref:Uncharacterized protein n=1 Tax=Moniliophthora roreri (strain MCA 2997) TaxID=1381753 RepID=V2YLS3_MONRO|nr:hypothetical protein Moror_4332 [Moniliophthora roreri MCA 2997]